MEKINWEEITKEQAQDIADELCLFFSVVAKCWQSDSYQDVSFIKIACHYDDNFHASEY